MFTQPDIRAESLRLGAARKLEGRGAAISCQQMHLLETVTTGPPFQSKACFLMVHTEHAGKCFLDPVVTSKPTHSN